MRPIRCRSILEPDRQDKQPDRCKKVATMLQALAGIIFDMDGVLCDSESFILEAAQTHLRRRYGIEASRADFAPFIGAGDDAFVGGVARAHGVTPQLPEDKYATYDLYEQLVVGRLQALPGVHSFLQRCRAAGLRLAVASSADRRKVQVNLAAIGVPESEFDAIISSEDVRAKKPAPDAFLNAAERLGLAPGRCLVIEDALNGVRAAGAAGCPCLGLTTSFSAEELRAAGAGAIAADLASVAASDLAAWGLQT